MEEASQLEEPQAVLQNKWDAIKRISRFKSSCYCYGKEKETKTNINIQILYVRNVRNEHINFTFIHLPTGWR